MGILSKLNIMKFHSPADVKLLTKGVKGLIGAWRLGVLKKEYKRFKKIQEDKRRYKRRMIDSLSKIRGTKHSLFFSF